MQSCAVSVGDSPGSFHVVSVRSARLAVLLLIPLTQLKGDDGPAAVVERRPVHHKLQVLVSSAELADWRYLAFPALLDLGDEVLVSFKRGRAHGADPGATLELVRLDPATGRSLRTPDARATR